MTLPSDAALLRHAAQDLDTIAGELMNLHSQWHAMGASPDALGWLESILFRLGYWNASLTDAAARHG